MNGPKCVCVCVCASFLNLGGNGAFAQMYFHMFPGFVLHPWLVPCSFSDFLAQSEVVFLFVLLVQLCVLLVKYTPTSYLLVVYCVHLVLSFSCIYLCFQYYCIHEHISLLLLLLFCLSVFFAFIRLTSLLIVLTCFFI